MRALALAVIRQAVSDCFSKSLAGATSEDEGITRHIALRFLTAVGDDDWAMARREWCFLADVDPDELRSHIVDVLEGRRDIELPDDDAMLYRLNGHEIARAQWANEKARHVAFLDDARQKIEARRATRHEQAETERDRRKEQRMRDAWDEAGRIIDEANHRLLYGT
jgi:hypothetical protein